MNLTYERKKLIDLMRSNGINPKEMLEILFIVRERKHQWKLINYIRNCNDEITKEILIEEANKIVQEN